MKNKLKFISVLIAIIIVGLILSIAFTINKKEITLIQLSPQSERQMMGYIIKTQNGKIIAIDGGTYEDTDNLIKYINDNGGKIDYWFLTHAHDDHASVLVKTLQENSVEVENIYVSLNEKEWYIENEPKRADFSCLLIDTLNQETIKNKVKQPSINEKIEIDGINVEILGIRNPEITENPGNEQSMVIKFDTGRTSLLILGDTGIKSSEKLLSNQREKLESDIVQMAHHGQNGATKELYTAVGPTTCLWPTPEWLWNNDGGEGYNTGSWKTIETRDWMKELGVKNNYVEKDGDIIIKIK